MIKYKNSSFKVRNNKEVKLTKGDPVIEEFFICGNNMKTVFDGSLDQLYRGDSNVYYFVYPHEKRASHIRADSLYGDKNDRFIKIDSILYKGIWYNAIRNVSQKGSMTYYYKKNIAIDPQAFKNCKFLEWAHFFKQTNGGIRLIAIEKNKRVYHVSEAIEITRMELTLSDFTIPSDFKIDKPNYVKIPLSE